jgi:hypothetical protein
MSYCADSSFLVSCYLLDANTPRAKGYLSGLTAPLPFTPLQTLEVGKSPLQGPSESPSSFPSTHVNACWPRSWD